MEYIHQDDTLYISLLHAIQKGETDALGRLLEQHPELASMRFQDNKGGSRTALHAVSDWPGYFPNGPEIVKMLIDAGADPNAPGLGGRFAETPLHWAASSDDVDVAVALIDGGADIEVLGGSIAGGTPLDNAVGYGCWNVARLLVQRGARVDMLWHASALGLMSRVAELMASSPSPSGDEINEAFFQACSGGQRRVAEYLLAKGADIHAIPDYSRLSALDAVGSPDTRRDTMITWLKGLGANSTK